MDAKALPGFRDFYPDLTALRNHIFGAWRRVAARYGFVEYEGPPLEPLALYTRKSGEEIVEQLFNFVDKGGREVALRPEMTPTLARMVAARARSLKKPIRWYSIPQLFRYEKQQRGRLREHYQFNLDLIGEPGPMADAEVIAAALDVMRELGLTSDDVRVRVSDRRVMRALLERECGVAEAALPAAYAAIDKIERVEPDALLEGLGRHGIEPSAGRRILDLAQLRSIDDIAGILRGRGAEDEAEGLTTCVTRLHDMGLGGFVEVDTSIVRGLAYYTGIVFELFDARRSMRAICGGGRYDGLLEALGGVDLPAAGFGMGDVVLGDLLKDRGWDGEASTRVDVFLVAVTGEDVPAILRLAHELRDRGVAVEYALKPQSVAKQLKLAAARPATCAVIVGPDERAAGQVVVRYLETGTEQRVTMTADALDGTVRATGGDQDDG